MAAYILVDSKLINPELYESYKLISRPLVESYGGEYLSRGGPISLKESKLWSPTRIVLLRFPSVEVAEKFYNSAEYQSALKISEQSSERTFMILEGM